MNCEHGTWKINNTRDARRVIYRNNRLNFDTLHLWMSGNISMFLGHNAMHANRYKRGRRDTSGYIVIEFEIQYQ